MSDKKTFLEKNTQSSETNKRLTRLTVAQHPELKNNLIPELKNKSNKTENPFSRKPKLVRSPIKTPPNNTETISDTDSTNTVTKQYLKQGAYPKNLSGEIKKIFSSENYKNNCDTDDEPITSKKPEINPISLENLEKITSPEINHKDIKDFFDTSNKNDFTDIDGFLNEQSLILTSCDQENTNNYLKPINNTHLLNKENLINFDQTISIMPAQKLKIESVVNSMSPFDGKDTSVDHFLADLKDASPLISSEDESTFVRLLIRQKFIEIAEGLFRFSKPSTIEELIKSLRELYPDSENFYKLRYELQFIRQKDDESVKEYIDRTLLLLSKIKEKKKYIPGITPEKLTAFNKKIEDTTTDNFKKGLKFMIQVKIGPNDDFATAAKKAIQIENEMKQEIKMNSSINNCYQDYSRSVYNNTKQKKILICQLCHERNHEALFCTTAACAYCQGSDHRSFDCSKTVKKIKLICNLCSNYGHSISACEFNRTEGRNCQFCQGNGHTIDTCPIILEYKICWKCKKPGHNPHLCFNVTEDFEICKYCHQTGHSSIKCPNAICHRCNNTGHTIKNCKLEEKRNRFRICNLCEELGHESSECEEAKILLMQQKTKLTTLCQICEKVGHSAKDCNTYKNSQQQNNSKQYMTHNNNRFPPPKKCSFCKATGHIISECKKYEKIKNFSQTKTQQNCDHCHKEGHSIDNCFVLKKLLNQIDKFCNRCKNVGHTDESCNRPQNYQGNGQTSFVQSEQEE